MKQKNTTGSTQEPKEQKTNRRNKAKYPALQKKYNLKGRQDYIEPDYIDGVYDQNGVQVIRPLNAEEKEWLNKFYEETVSTNFLHDPELRRAQTRLKELKKLEKLTEEEEEELMFLQMEYLMLADENLLYPDHEDQKKLYGENNARNRCLYNRVKSVGMLDELNNCTYDEMHKNMYGNDVYGETAIINMIEPIFKKD